MTIVRSAGLVLLTVCVAGFVVQAAAQSSRRVLSPSEEIDGLKLRATQQQERIDNLVRRWEGQQAQIDQLSATLANTVEELRALRVAHASDSGAFPRGPIFTAGGILRSSWDALPNEAVIPYRLNGAWSYAHKSRFDVIPDAALFEFRGPRGTGAISKAGFARIPADALVAYFLLSGD
jgi:hypothetical protein